MKKHSSKKKALLIALAVIVVLILGAVGACLRSYSWILQIQ